MKYEKLLTMDEDGFKEIEVTVEEEHYYTKDEESSVIREISKEEFNKIHKSETK